MLSPKYDSVANRTASLPAFATLLSLGYFLITSSGSRSTSSELLGVTGVGWTAIPPSDCCPAAGGVIGAAVGWGGVIATGRGCIGAGPTGWGGDTKGWVIVTGPGSRADWVTGDEACTLLIGKWEITTCTYKKGSTNT